MHCSEEPPDLISAESLETIQQIANVEGDLHGITGQRGWKRLGSPAHILSISTELDHSIIRLGAEFDDIVVLIRQNSDPLQGGDQSTAIKTDGPGESIRNQLPVIGICAFQRAAGDHLISSQEHHLPAIAEQTHRLL